MKLCICFGICLSSKWFHIRLTVFLSSNLALIIAPQTSIHINCFMVGGWHTSCHSISKLHNVGERPSETPSALRGLSYLINSLLSNRHKTLLKLVGSRGGHSPPHFCCLYQKLSLSFLTLIKLWSSLVPGPKAKSSSSEITNLTSFTVSYQGSAVFLAQGISLGWSWGVSHAGFLPTVPQSLSGSRRLWTEFSFLQPEDRGL